MSSNKTIDDLDNKIDDLLLQFTKGYGALTVTFSGKIGDDTKVFQMPYNTLREGIKLLISDQRKAITQAMLEALPEKVEWDMSLDLTGGEVDQYNKAIDQMETAIKKMGGER